MRLRICDKLPGDFTTGVGFSALIQPPSFTWALPPQKAERRVGEAREQVELGSQWRLGGEVDGEEGHRKSV